MEESGVYKLMSSDRATAYIGQPGRILETSYANMKQRFEGKLQKSLNSLPNYYYYYNNNYY